MEYKQIIEVFYYPETMTDEEVKSNPTDKSIGYERLENGKIVEQKGKIDGDTKFIKSTELVKTNAGFNSHWEEVKKDDDDTNISKG